MYAFKRYILSLAPSYPLSMLLSYYEENSHDDTGPCIRPQATKPAHHEGVSPSEMSERWREALLHLNLTQVCNLDSPTTTTAKRLTTLPICKNILALPKKDRIKIKWSNQLEQENY
jgi:hypothetical protein